MNIQTIFLKNARLFVQEMFTIKKRNIDWVIDFNGMSTGQGIFHA